MDFTGRLYFDFTSPDVWRFYRMLVAAQQEGVRIGLEWKPFVVGGLDGTTTGQCRLLQASEVVRQDVPLRHGGFVPAILSAIHDEGASADDPELILLASRVAGLADGLVDDVSIDGPGRVLLERSQSEAETLGVDAVPTLYRHGPVLTVRTTGAAAMSGAAARLETISRVLDDDGLWVLRKP
jgi:2-hydroxychromene-2-carboxylate isomerase